MARAYEHHLRWLRTCVFAAGEFSTCAKRQYFAVILSPEGRCVGTGYNGSPPGVGHCNQGHCPRLLEDSPSGSSYDNCIAIHAEENALLWSDRFARAGGTMIVNGPPCFACSKAIAGSGLSKVVYLRDENYLDWPRGESILRAAGVAVLGIHEHEVQ